MEKIPSFAAFEAALKRNIQDIKIALREGKYALLFLYFILLVGIIFVTLAGTAVAFHTFLPQGIVPPTVNRVSLVSYYRKSSENKNDDGTYTTIFDIFVHTPPYWFPKDPNKPDAGFHFLWSGDDQRQCDKPKELGSEVETTGGYSSSTVEYEFICKTYRPILDNGHLFSIEEN